MVCNPFVHFNYLARPFPYVLTFFFLRHRTNKLNLKARFRFLKGHRVEHRAQDILLCSECANHLVHLKGSKEKNSGVHAWPAFLWSFLENEDLHCEYDGEYLWKFIPEQWRYWWLDSIGVVFPHYFGDVSISEPEPFFKDRTPDIDEFNEDIESYLLARLAKTCNEHVMPLILCPWGCSEYNHM